MENTRNTQHLLTAREAGLVGCSVCGRVHPAKASVCLRCGAAICSRAPYSLQKVWAWLAAGIITFIPANTYPMLVTETLGSETRSTLIGGVLELMHHGSFGIAAIVFFASIVIPGSKFMAIAYLALGIGRPQRLSTHRRHQMYELVEFVGRWSMIDVFVVAILTALVQLGSAASIHPGIAAVSFALSVVFTMLAAQSFDPKLVWDADKDTHA
jgi:paraquat-inducible protein A